jgi:hypothetical protein
MDVSRELESDLERALKNDMANEGLLAPQKATPPFPPRPTIGSGGLGKVVDPREDKPERTADQLGLAVKGLLQVEQELQAFANELVGDIKVEDEASQATSEETALIPRVRANAEAIARAAIRVQRLIEEMRARL